MKKTIKSKKKTSYYLTFTKSNSTGLELYAFEEILNKKASGHGIGMGVEDICFTYNNPNLATNAFLLVLKHKDIENVTLEKKRE